MNRLILIAAIVAIGLTSLVRGSVVTSTGEDWWTHQVKFDAKTGFTAKWRNSPVEEDGTQWVIMEVSAKTKGYVAVGVSPKGGMANADMVMGWVDGSGKGHIRDLYGVNNGIPYEDREQDYELIEAYETPSRTIIKFRRKWDTCDDQDINFVKDTTRMIWAIGDKDPTFNRDGSINLSNHYHGMNRGVQSVFMADDAMSFNFPDEAQLRKSPDIKTWDMTMKNVEVTQVNTTYHCRIEKFPDSGKKHHLIGWKPIIQKEWVRNVHHIVFYECFVPDDQIPLFDSHVNEHPGSHCYTKNMPPAWGKSCTAFLLVWTVGSEGEMLPEHVGATLGQEHGGATYFMIEMHYENPQGLTIHDNSGIRIYYTDKLRENEGSILLLGYRHSPFLLIPPKQHEFMINGVCARECLEETLPPQGISVVTTFIHAHLWGKRLRLRHFRNGTELPVIAEDNYYDFDYQQSRTLKQEIKVMPGDELLTECVYDTEEMNRVVLGGLATSQEMCQTFLFYYPKIEIGQCTSQSEFGDFMHGFGVDRVSGDVLNSIGMPYDPKGSLYDPGDTAKELEESGDGASFRSVFDEINIDQPRTLQGISVGEHLRRMNWYDKSTSKNLEDTWRDGKHYQFCTKVGSRRIPLKHHIVDYPKITNPLPPPNERECKKQKLRKAPTSGASHYNIAGNSLMLVTLLPQLWRFL